MFYYPHDNNKTKSKSGYKDKKDRKMHNTKVTKRGRRTQSIYPSTKKQLIQE